MGRNRLAQETSPYLLQHADNPVDWYPWGEEAFAAARSQGKPIFLSIGYSTCHWCHVMAHESFENELIAQLMNEHFINVKVDREERPDIDHLYMTAAQAMSPHLGWPLSMWLTPDLQPFQAGTYFPPEPRPPLPGFGDVLRGLAEAYKTRAAEAAQAGGQLMTSLDQAMKAKHPKGELDEGLLEKAYYAFAAAFDRKHGGFGQAPKFPRSMTLGFLLRRYQRGGEKRALEMVETTLDRMAAGGLYDLLGGGFARYSVDDQWLVPHFEKMLYDNALLAQAYLEGYQACGRPRHAVVVRETLDYILREMTHEEGGFFSAEDADSEGEEGKFYVWRPADVEAAVGAELAPLACAHFGVNEGGNFEFGTTVLRITKTAAELAEAAGQTEDEVAAKLAAIRDKMLAARNTRPRPGRDDKIISGWNGLVISALARAGRVLDEPRYIEAAARAMAFIDAQLSSADGGLLRSWRGSASTTAGTIEDHAFVIRACLDLYEATWELRYVERALALEQLVADQFHDPAAGGYWLTRSLGDLPLRTKETNDAALPAGTSMMAGNLLRLADLTGRAPLRARAEALLALHVGRMEQAPPMFPEMLCVLDDALAPAREVVLAGDLDSEAGRALARAAAEPFLPGAVRARVPTDPEARAAAEALIPMLAERHPEDGAPRAFVCEGHSCQLPATDAEQLAGQLSG